MFTGLVEELGKVKAIRRGQKSAEITIAAEVVLQDIKLGDSIAVNGTCLTVIEYNSSYFTADVMPETFERTVLAKLKPGDHVNLERTLRLGDRLGGHMVSGHIDGIGVITSKMQHDNAILFDITAGPEIMHYVVKKGSIAIDGISLTVVSCGENRFTVSLIPHTAKMTTLGFKGVGMEVNLEADIIGKYVAKFTGFGIDAETKKINQQGLSIEFLQQHGFTR